MGTMIVREMNHYSDWEWTEIASFDTDEESFPRMYDELINDGWSVMRIDSGASFRTAAFSQGEINRDITYCYPDDEAREREQRWYG